MVAMHVRESFGLQLNFTSATHGYNVNLQLLRPSENTQLIYIYIYISTYIASVLQESAIDDYVIVNQPKTY